MRQRTVFVGGSHSLLVIGFALIASQGTVAQIDYSLPCCTSGFFPGEVYAVFGPETSLEQVEEIAAEFGVQITEIGEPFPVGTFYSFCVPLGEETSFVTMFNSLPEVTFAARNGKFCSPVNPPCECCPCGLEECPFIPTCETECELDADGDTFADSCDTCTDTDNDGFGDPEFDVSFTECEVDNCPDVSNPDQADLDMDGGGDVCDGGLTICHVPPGNPARAHTITITTPAWPAHMQHGDVPGACEAREGRRRGRDRPPVNPRTSRPATFQKAGQQLNF